MTERVSNCCKAKVITLSGGKEMTVCTKCDNECELVDPTPTGEKEVDEELKNEIVCSGCDYGSKNACLNPDRTFENCSERKVWLNKLERLILSREQKARSEERRVVCGEIVDLIKGKALLTDDEAKALKELIVSSK